MKSLLLTLALAMGCLLPATMMADNTKLEAEDANYSHCKLITDNKYSGRKALEITEENARISFSYQAAVKGKYTVYVGYDGLYGEKVANLSVNGGNGTVTDCYYVTPPDVGVPNPCPISGAVQVTTAAPAGGIYRYARVNDLSVYSGACTVSGIGSSYDVEKGAVSITPVVTATTGAALALGMIAGCGPSKPELHIYTWSDYVDEDVKSKFEEENNCKVVIDTFDSNEAMYAKLQAGSTGYDIITPSSYQIPLMAKNKMIIPLDHSKIPNVKKNFDAAFANSILDPSFTYNAPYMVTYTGIAYRKDKIAKDVPVDSWKIYETAALKGRMSLLSDMRETIGAALKSLGYSLNSEKKEELDKAVEVVIGWKKNIAKFDNEQYKTAVASGEWFVGHGYSSDVIQTMLDNENVGFSLPKEGFTVACDEMVVAADSKKVDLAHKFIDFCYDPDVAAANMTEVCAPMPVAPAFPKLEESLRKLVVIDAETLKKGEVIRDFSDQPTIHKLYVDAWDKIKAAK